jgi:hypothetical protein
VRKTFQPHHPHPLPGQNDVSLDRPGEQKRHLESVSPDSQAFDSIDQEAREVAELRSWLEWLAESSHLIAQFARFAGAFLVIFKILMTIKTLSVELLVTLLFWQKAPG